MPQNMHFINHFSPTLFRPDIQYFNIVHSRVRLQSQSSPLQKRIKLLDLLQNASLRTAAADFSSYGSKQNREIRRGRVTRCSSSWGFLEPAGDGELDVVEGGGEGCLFLILVLVCN